MHGECELCGNRINVSDKNAYHKLTDDYNTRLLCEYCYIDYEKWRNSRVRDMIIKNKRYY